MFLSRTIVGLGEKRREMGTSARNQLVMNPKSTIWGFKHLIGRSFSDPFIKRERQGLPYDVVETGRDGLGIKVGAIDNLETLQLTFSVSFVNSPPPPPPIVMFASPQVLISLCVLLHQVPGGEAPQTYSPEQVMAMFLTYLKKVAESSLGKPVVDCVISVRPHPLPRPPLLRIISSLHRFRRSTPTDREELCWTLAPLPASPVSDL